MINMRSYLIRFSFICSVLIFLFFFQNCIGVGVNFSTIENEFLSESAETPEVSQSEAPLGETHKIHSEEFISEIRKKAVDMVWVVDNSGSMTEEADHVRRNFHSFINTLESNIDIKVILLSRSETTVVWEGVRYYDHYKAHVYLPEDALANGHIQIEQHIHSQNSLTLLNFYLPQMVNTMFRKDSQKVFVFVTDENSDVPYSDFVNAYKDILPNESPVVYSFITLETRELSPCGVIENHHSTGGDYFAHGAEYKKLSNMTGGKIYNICDSDWSQHFSTLANHVIEKTITSLILKKKGIKKILDLKIDGQSIDSNFYQIVDNILTIDPSLINQLNLSDIEGGTVTYLYED